MRLAGLALLATLLVAPTALACDYFIPEGPRHVLWTDGERVIVDRDGAFGYRRWSGGAFEPLVDPFDLMSPRVSPDGTWIVWQEASGTGADCSPQNGRLLAKRIEGGEPFVLHEGSVRAFDASDTHVAFVPLGAREVVVAPLATREMTKRFDLPGDHAVLVRLSADARFVAVSLPLQERLLVLDTTSGETALGLELKEDVQGVAFSPDARRVATLTGFYGQSATLRVHEIPPGTIIATREFEGETGAALVWSASGIAAATYTIEYSGDGTTRHTSSLRVFGAPSTLGREAVTPFAERRIESIAATPEGDLILAANEDLFRVEAEPAQDDGAATPTATGQTPVSPPQKPVPAPGPAVLALALSFAILIAARSSARRRS